MTAAGRFWACYFAALVALGLASCARPAHAAAPAPGARCLLTAPGTAPADVQLGQPLRLFDGGNTASGWWVTPPAGRPDLAGVWFVPAAWLSWCQS